MNLVVGETKTRLDDDNSIWLVVNSLLARLVRFHARLLAGHRIHDDVHCVRQLGGQAHHVAAATVHFDMYVLQFRPSVRVGVYDSTFDAMMQSKSLGMQMQDMLGCLPICCGSALRFSSSSAKGAMRQSFGVEGALQFCNVYATADVCELNVLNLDARTQNTRKHTHTHTPIRRTHDASACSESECGACTSLCVSVLFVVCACFSAAIRDLIFPMDHNHNDTSTSRIRDLILQSTLTRSTT